MQRIPHLGALAAIMIALIGAVATAAPAGAQQAAPIIAAPCPAPTTGVNSVEVCIDRGDGALYLDGEELQVCVTVNVPQIAIFPPPPPPTVRLISLVNGGNQQTIFSEAFNGSSRCRTAPIGPPFGQETIRAEVVGANGAIIATDSVNFRSAARTGGGQTGIAVTVDRGAGGVYAVGDSLTACVTVTQGTFGRAPRVRLTFVTSNGATARVLELGVVASGRCDTITVAGPAGPATVRADALDPISVALLASATTGYTIGQSPPPPSGPSGPPTRISGTVYQNGFPLGGGATVQAIVRGSICGSAFVGSGGSYVLDVATASSRAGCGVDGDVISFTAAGLNANETAIFQSGAFLTLNLSLGGPPPAAGGSPTNLVATVLDATRVQLVWSDNSPDEFGFRVYDGYNAIATTPPNTNAFTVVGLAPGSYHCFRVTALRPGGESAPSDWACATTGFGGGGGAAPSAPNGLRATPVAGAAVRLDWFDTSFNEDGFRISNGVTIITTLGPGATSYTTGPLTPGAWTCFQVQAFNGAGASGWSDWACTTTLGDGGGGGAPSAPAGLRASLLSPGRVLLEWFDTSFNESGFRISNGDIIMGAVGADTQSVTVEVAPFSYGCFQVQAFGPGGDSPWTDWACLAT